MTGFAIRFGKRLAESLEIAVHGISPRRVVSRRRSASLTLTFVEDADADMGRSG